MKFRQLSIVTITFNDASGLIRTINSLAGLIQGGAKLIVIDGGNDDTMEKPMLPIHTNYVCEADKGIYDALNKGLSRVSTDYFIILHSGDCLIMSAFELAFEFHLKSSNNLTLNAVKIVDLNNKKILRTHSPLLWQSWMLSIQVQPPHLGIIYCTNFVNGLKFNEKLKIISDFIFIKELFYRNPKYMKTGIEMVHMTSGGKTTSGLISVINVTKEFIKIDGFIKTIICLTFRLVLKNVHRFNNYGLNSKI